MAVGHLFCQQPLSGRSSLGRPARYALLSIFCGTLAQGALAIAYGVFGWGTAAAVLFSLTVSIVPSYWGSRVYVWSALSRMRQRTEVAMFLIVAAAGSGAAIVLTSGAQILGENFTHDRAVLTVWVSAGSVIATAVVWVARFLFLDNFLFRSARRSTRSANQQVTTSDGLIGS